MTNLKLPFLDPSGRLPAVGQKPVSLGPLFPTGPSLERKGPFLAGQGLRAIFNGLFDGTPIPHPSRRRALPSATTAKRGVALRSLVPRAPERDDLPSVPPASKGGARSPGKNQLSFSTGAERKFNAGKLKSTGFCRGPCGFWCARHHRVDVWPRRGKLSPATPKLGLAPSGVQMAKKPAGREWMVSVSGE